VSRNHYVEQSVKHLQEINLFQPSNSSRDTIKKMITISCCCGLPQDTECVEYISKLSNDTPIRSSMITSVCRCCICRLIPSYNKEDDWIQSVRNTFTSFHNKACSHLFHTFSHQVTFHHHPTIMVADHCSNDCYVMSRKSMETQSSSTLFALSFEPSQNHLTIPSIDRSTMSLMDNPTVNPTALSCELSHPFNLLRKLIELSLCQPILTISLVN